MYETLDRHVRVFAARVRHFDRRSICFFEARDYLATNRAIGIFGVDQVKKVGGDRKRELVAGQQDAGAFFAGKGDLPLELAQVGDSVFKLPFPVVPVFRSDIGPETRREGKEPLVGGLGLALHDFVDWLVQTLRAEFRLSIRPASYRIVCDALFVGNLWQLLRRVRPCWSVSLSDWRANHPSDLYIL